MGDRGLAARRVLLLLDADGVLANAVVLESGHFWRQSPALECAVFVQPGGILGQADLRGLAGILRDGWEVHQDDR